VVLNDDQANIVQCSDLVCKILC